MISTSPRFASFRGLMTPAPRSALGLALGLGILLVATGCNDDTGAATATPAAASVTTQTPTAPPAVAAAAPAPPAALPIDPSVQGPQITFTELVHDFGVITDARTHPAAFDFTNTGNGTLVINDIKAACGCTVPTLRKRQYAPGESGRIEIIFDPKGKQGVTPKNITVISNGSPQPLKLQLLSDIKPLLRFERMQRLGTLALHEEVKKRFNFTYTDRGLKIHRVSLNNANLTAEIIERDVITATSAEETTYELTIEVTVSPETPWGLIFATRMTINVEASPWPGEPSVPYTYDMFLTGDVFGEIRAPRTMISLSQLTPRSSYEQRTTISSVSGSPFKVLSATVAESSIPGVQVRVDPAGMAAYDVVISGDVGGYTGSIRGAVVIMTDIESEGPLTLRFAGLVR